MRRPEPFELLQPSSLKQASEMQLEKGAGAYFLAGGTDLVIAIKEKGLNPACVIDLKRIPSLSGIRQEIDGGIRIGALTTMREVETSALIRRRYPFVSQSAAEVGSVQIRNRATVGGNVANATPSADLVPALLVLDANVRIFGVEGERPVPLDQFFLGPGKTILQRGDVLTELLIPPSPASLRGEYIKFSPREMMDLAYIGVAVAIALDHEQQCMHARIALGAVSPTPLRARKAEESLLNQVLTGELAERAGEIASEECRPISDVRSSAEYRREMVRVNTKRALLNSASGRPEALPWLARREARYES